MEKPFPGMDPYLEAPSIWPDVQHSLIVAMSNQINQCLSADYVTVISPYIAAEEIDFSGVHTIHRSCANAVSKREGHATEVTVAPLEIGDLTKVPTRYARLELRSVDGDVLITSIELLSPANKRPGADGADAYQQKRQEVFNSTAHLVEIDLLRDGQRSSFIDPLPDAAYFIFCSRSYESPDTNIWPIQLHDALPPIGNPLRRPDPDVPLDLGKALREIYANAHYERRINYRNAPPSPELSSEDAIWLDTHVRERGLQTG